MINLQEEVARCVAEHPVPQDAARELEAKARANPELRDAITDKVLPQLCFDAVAQYNRLHIVKPAWDAGLRPEPIRAAMPGKPSIAKQLRTNAFRATAASQMWLSLTPLLNQKLLKDSTYADVIAAAEHYERSGKTALHKARWLRAISYKMDKFKPVGSSLTEEQLRALQDASVEAINA
jgi:hypothetical protein